MDYIPKTPLIKKVEKTSKSSTIIKLNEIMTKEPNFTLGQLRRLPSKIEENKKIVRLRVKRSHKSMHSASSILSSSLVSPALYLQAPKAEDAIPRRLKFVSEILMVPKKTIKYTLEKTELKDSLLDHLGKSDKLHRFMQKLGTPCLALNESSLWSKETHKKKLFFNTSVYNSGILTRKILNNLKPPL